MKKIAAALLAPIIIFCHFETVVSAEEVSLNISAPSAILMEASTGQVIYERNAEERLHPASITKIMTLLLIFEALEEGKISLTDQVTTSAYAKSMGGSQVFLEEGEVQTVDTLIKCIAVASGNDAAVAMAEYIAGSEEEFVKKMNKRAKELGMEQTTFEDCCGLTDSEGHMTTARDVALMSRELIVKHPDIYNYTKIWMEDIVHETARGSTPFTLSSTNKLLKQYEYATGLKTGSTNAAKYCLSATARKNDIDLIAVIMKAPDHKVRFSDAVSLLNYGFSVSNVYKDENKDSLNDQQIAGGVEESVPLVYGGAFQYLDVSGKNLSQVTKEIKVAEVGNAPVEEGQKAGEAVYMLDGAKIGSVDILYGASVKEAVFKDYIWKVLVKFWL
ncbi:MAG: D-alanyl-D-alanine carboxypeptidase [Roseburia sp.]|nr:D-alanyl-D-alanine carboxypeptidase [Roseburia sp.]MCM1277519.1 D-alanyl-D-alanine carboxypeptidase [Robinsoniella sp.]